MWYLPIHIQYNGEICFYYFILPGIGSHKVEVACPPKTPNLPCIGKYPEDLYVCNRPIEMPGLAQDCNCAHTDIYGSESGEIYQGFYGAVPPDHLGVPTGEGWKCTKLERRNEIPAPGLGWPFMENAQ